MLIASEVWYNFNSIFWTFEEREKIMEFLRGLLELEYTQYFILRESQINWTF